MDDDQNERLGLQKTLRGVRAGQATLPESSRFSRSLAALELALLDALSELDQQPHHRAGWPHR